MLVCEGSVWQRWCEARPGQCSQAVGPIVIAPDLFRDALVCAEGRCQCDVNMLGVAINQSQHDGILGVHAIFGLLKDNGCR